VDHHGRPAARRRDLLPIFKGITKAANPALLEATQQYPVKVYADPNNCTFQFDPVGKATFRKSCDVAKSFLSKKGIPYTNEVLPAGQIAYLTVGTEKIEAFEGSALSAADFKTQSAAFAAKMNAATRPTLPRPICRASTRRCSCSSSSSSSST